MATIDSLRSLIQAELPACPAFSLDNAIRSGCRAFSKDTWAIKSDISITLVAGTQSYTLTAPTDHEVFAVDSAVLNGAAELAPTSGRAKLRHIQVSGIPMAYWVQAGKLWVYPTPSEAATVLVDAVIRPLNTSANVDDRFAEHLDAVGSYARYSLMSTTAQTWSNPEAAAANYRVYRSLVGEYRVPSARGHVNESRRLYNRFF